MRYVYIAGPYRGTKHGNGHDYRSYFEIDRNIARATEVAALLAVAGVGFFNPHGHSRHFEVIAPEAQPAFWYELDMHFLDACDAIIMLEGWQSSRGSCAEWDRANERGMPVFYNIEEVYQWILETNS